MLVYNTTYNPTTVLVLYHITIFNVLIDYERHVNKILTTSILQAYRVIRLYIHAYIFIIFSTRLGHYTRLYII